MVMLFWKKVGRPNILEDHLILKVKNIATGIQQAGGLINRRQILNIGKVVIRANNPDILIVCWNCVINWSLVERYSNQTELEET